jgi:hypothetical protein
MNLPVHKPLEVKQKVGSGTEPKINDKKNQVNCFD